MTKMTASNAYKIDLQQKALSKSKNQNDNLKETFYCNYSHPMIQKKAVDFKRFQSDESTLIKNIFLFVRDGIVFGGDRWRVKASETLNKGYGACYNKNLLFIALLRSFGIQAKLMANPMRKDFMKPAMGIAYLTVSNPFMHCFTEICLNNRWISVDPTLDERTYQAFFAPLQKSWGIDWDGHSDMVLYENSIVGPSKYYLNIDEELQKNLNSHFLFRHEPDFILSTWLSIGNNMMWKPTGNSYYLKHLR